MRIKTFAYMLFIVLLTSIACAKKVEIKALYIPLADHYAALVAYDKYTKDMKYADLKLQKMRNWDLLRSLFQEGRADMSFVMSPLAMDMFSEKPHFKWIGLMHRDGNALAINEIINTRVKLRKLREERKPDDKVAKAFADIYKETGNSIIVGLPHILSTHGVVLYRYLKENGLSIAFKANKNTDVLAITVAPPKAPSFIKKKSRRSIPAAFEQSLPWADVVETGGYGKVAWYSKDVMPFKHGHVECIALATNKAIKEKQKAIKEVMYYIHKAGADIEEAKRNGGAELEAIVKIVRKYIPKHTAPAIRASLDVKLNVINFAHLNIDKPGLKQIMDYAVEGKILKQGIDIDSFADDSFYIELKK